MLTEDEGLPLVRYADRAGQSDLVKGYVRGFQALSNVQLPKARRPN